MAEHFPFIKFGPIALPYLACACGWDDRGDVGWGDHLRDVGVTLRAESDTDWPLTEEGCEQLRDLAETAIAKAVHPANWSYWVTHSIMAGPVRDFIEMVSPTLVIAMLDSHCPADQPGAELETVPRDLEP